MVEIHTGAPKELGLYRGDSPERVRALAGQFLHLQAELGQVPQPVVIDAASERVQHDGGTNPVRDLLIGMVQDPDARVLTVMRSHGMA